MSTRRTMADIQAAKRRRVSSPINRNDIVLRDLPNEALAHAAGYLSRPSRALFSIALFRHEPNTNSASDGDLSRAILCLNGQQRTREEQDGILDFGKEIEESLAAKLTDDDLRVILLSIDANTKLKRLKLTGCVNVTGAGLDPLRGSSVLEQIDLSLVAEHKSPVLDPEPFISYALVVPILDSVISRDDTAMHSIVYPKSWGDYHDNTVLRGFIDRCRQMLQRRNINCQRCEGEIEYHLGSCYKCMKHYCYNHDEDGETLLKRCDICEKEYCHECADMDECVECFTRYCIKCRRMGHCQRGCEAKICDSCVDHSRKCDTCNTVACHYCDRSHKCQGSGCFKMYCRDCRMSGVATLCDRCPPNSYCTL